jgi:hypothetical protein
VAVQRRARRSAAGLRRKPRSNKNCSDSPTSDSTLGSPLTPETQHGFSTSPITSSPSTLDLPITPRSTKLNEEELWLPQSPVPVPDNRKTSALYLDFASYLDTSSAICTTSTLTPIEEIPLNSASVYPSPAAYIRSNLLWGISAPQHISTISYFFHSHVLRQRHVDTQKGFLELLGPIYGRSSPGSLLHRATYAVALGCLSATQNSVTLKSEARTAYGRVLKELSTGLQSPGDDVMNEMILSILLCGLCEQISNNINPGTEINVDPRTWTRHVSGAIALVKMRGRSQLVDEESRKLFRAVRAQMLKASLENNTPIEDFPDIDGWNCDRNTGDVNGANKLAMLSLGLPRMRCRAKELIAMNKTDAVVREMLQIMDEALNLDHSLETFFQTLPDVWAGKIVDMVTEEPLDITKAQCWPGPQVLYEDLNVAGAAADYRVVRIMCSGVVRHCFEALPTTARTAAIQRMFTKAVYIARDMVNQICSTVPYFLGYGIEYRNDGRTSADRACKCSLLLNIFS